MSRDHGPVESHARDVAAHQRWASLRIFADSFHDIQEARKAITNRTMEKKLKDGTRIPPVLQPHEIADVLVDIDHAEKKLAKAMKAAFKRADADLYRWSQETVGIGEHLTARLLGATGHPIYAQPYHWEGEGENRTLVADEPFERSLSQWWAYCGHGDPERRKRRGMTADDAIALGNPTAKMLAHLLADSAFKCVGSANSAAQPIWDPPADASLASGTSSASIPIPVASTGEISGGESHEQTNPTGVSTRRRSPYRDVYDYGRLKYERRDEWTPIHRHNAALRLVAKEILRDLWLEARKGGASQVANPIGGTPRPRSAGVMEAVA